MAMEPTLQEALSKVVGQDIPIKTSAKTAQPAKPSGTSAAYKPAGTVKDLTPLIDKAAQHYENAEQAQRKGDWAAYGREIEALKRTLEELKAVSRR